MKMKIMGGLTDVPGILMGNAEDKSGRTGCTVILCPNGAVPGVEVSGGSPGTLNTDFLRPGTAEYPVYGVLLSGGSFFGLPAAGGVMRWLVEKGIDEVPLVPGAIIYDLPYAQGSSPPDAALAYAACQAANAGPVAEGNVGAGAGATVGKIYGIPMKGGLGTASLQIPGALWWQLWRWSMRLVTYGIGVVSSWVHFVLTGPLSTKPRHYWTMYRHLCSTQAPQSL